MRNWHTCLFSFNHMTWNVIPLTASPLHVKTRFFPFRTKRCCGSEIIGLLAHICFPAIEHFMPKYIPCMSKCGNIKKKTNKWVCHLDTSNNSVNNVSIESNSITSITHWLFIPSKLIQEARLLTCICALFDSQAGHRIIFLKLFWISQTLTKIPGSYLKSGYHCFLPQTFQFISDCHEVIWWFGVLS